VCCTLNSVPFAAPYIGEMCAGCFGRGFALACSQLLNHSYGFLVPAAEMLSENRMTLGELRDRISEDQITRDDLIAALREPLAETDDGYLRSKLKQAITSANIYYSSRRWGITERSKRQRLD
jgi:hypothetical protein